MNTELPNKTKRFPRLSWLSKLPKAQTPVYKKCLFVALALALVLHSPLATSQFLTDTIEPRTTTFIVPNEFDMNAYEAIVQNMQGALIGVGTFRLLNLASQGQFSHIFMIDYDQNVVDYNRSMIELLASSQNRLEFLSQVMRTDWPKAEAMEPTLASIISESTKRAEKNFFTDDQAFLKVQLLARQGRIHILPGDLAGTRTFDSIGTYLRQLGVNADVVDVSNSMDYFDSIDELEKVAQNIQKLPLTENSQVLFTMSMARLKVIRGFDYEEVALKSVDDTWGYMSAQALKFSQLISTPAFRDRQPYFLSRVRDALPRGVIARTPIRLHNTLSCLKVIENGTQIQRF